MRGVRMTCGRRGKPGENRRAQRTALLAAASAVCLITFAFRSDAADETRLVERVIDGDTIELDGGEKVRLIGVDTPETVHPVKPIERFGKEASAFTRRLAEGKRVRLEGEFGVQKRDRYGRTLAYVWLPDGELLNLEIIRQGYGFAYTKYPFFRMEEFRAAEREARDKGRGLWAEDVGAEDEDVHEGEPPGTSRLAEQPDCIPADQCCRVCTKGQACGNSCISARYTCHKGRGCSCTAKEVCR